MLSLKTAVGKKILLAITLLFTWQGYYSSQSAAQSRVALNLSDHSLRNELISAQRAPTEEPSYALILPGILGERFWDNNVQAGIRNSNFRGQTEIYDWTKGPLMMAANIGGSVQQSEILVQRILEFKRQFPARPLYLIGHSGGCRMVVQILEQLPEGTRVERAILLSPCMESTYNLSNALANTDSGLVVFHSPLDLAISVPLTMAHGFVQGRLDQTGATAGFKMPKHLNANQMALYQSRLIQHRFDRSMVWFGNTGGHFGWTVPRFVANYVAPYLVQSN